MTMPPALRTNLDELVNFAGTSARVFGTFGEVAAMIDRAHAAGRVVHVTPPRPARNGQVVVDIKLRPHRSPARRRRVLTLVVTAAVVLVVLVVAAVLALQWLLAHLAQVLATAAIVGALLALGSKATCSGVHIKH